MQVFVLGCCFFGRDHLVLTDALFIGYGGSILKLHSDNCKLF